MKLRLFLLVPFLFLLTGCFDYNELNKLALVTGLSIDKSGNLYDVGVLITESKKNDNNSNIVLRGRGNTLSEAIKEIELASPKKLYLGHLGVVIISDSIAKGGLNEITDFLIREPESAKRFYIVLARDAKAVDGLKAISPNLNFESQNLYQNIKISNESNDVSLNVAFIDFVESLVTDGVNGVIPSVRTKKNMIIGSVGMFRNDKLVGYASNDASIGIGLLKGSINKMVVSSNCAGGKAVSSVNNITTKINANKLGVKIKITGDAYLKEANCYINISDEKEIRKLEENFENEISKVVNKAISESKNYKTDIFGYGNLIYKKNPNYFSKVKMDWDNKYYLDLDTSVKVDLKLSNEGNIIKTVKEAIIEK